jgi:type I restriction enzyme S subunit
MTWDKLAIGDFCRTGSGGTPSRKKASRYFGGNIPWVKSGELREGVITETEETITELAVIESSAKFIPKGALLVAMYGATIGRVAKLGIDATSNQAVCHILPDESLADMQYMFHALQAQVPHWLGKGVGGAQPNISQEIIKNTVIPLPPLEEQRRIAAILDKTAWLYGQTLEQLNKAKELLASLFVETVGDPLQNPRSWSTIPLAEAVQIGTDVTYGIVQAGEEFLGGIPYIRTGDIANGEIVTSSLRHTDPAIASRFVRSTVRTGEIVMSIRATVGTTAMVPACLDGANLTQGTARIAPGERTNGLYLLQYLRMPSTQAWIQRQVKGATFREITLARLRELPVLLPPMAVQEAFASRAKIGYSTIESTKALTARAQILSLSLSNQLLG